MNVAELILARGEALAPAVIFRGGAMTYACLREQVGRVAGALVAQGYAKGERIGMFSENCPFFIITYLGIIRAGLVAVPLQTELTQEGLEQIARDSGFKALFVSRRYAPRLRLWVEASKLRMLEEGQWPEALSAVEMPEISPASDLAALMFTSGSTGKPKGVMVSHRNIECNSVDIIQYMGLTAGDRVLVVLPLHYCFGTSLLHTHLMAGGSLVLNNDFRLYPEKALHELKEHNCTGLAGVPSTYQLLLRQSRFREMSFPSLRWFQQAGGKLPNPCIEELSTAFPEVRYYLMYGQTEATARLSYLPPEELEGKLGSIGRGLPSTTLEVLKPDGRAVVPGGAEIGEIVASGDNITLGYWRDPVETAKYFRNGKLYTGDLARVDADGFIYVVERERDMIKAGGNRVSAKEIEEVISELPSVVEVAVIGAPHELLGEAIYAVVVPQAHAELTAAAVQEHCRQRLASFKVPKEVLLVRTMPHNGSGKVLKHKLKELLEKSTPPTLLALAR